MLTGLDTTRGNADTALAQLRPEGGYATPRPRTAAASPPAPPTQSGSYPVRGSKATISDVQRTLRHGGTVDAEEYPARG